MAVASVVLNRLLPLIENAVREGVDLLLNADDRAQNLSEKLKKIQEALADAERRRVKDPRVKSWLQELQGIAYEIEDALETWEVVNIKQNESNEDDSSDSWEKKVRSFLQSVCLCFKQNVRRYPIALDINQIHERLDSIAQENEDNFKFIPNLGYVGCVSLDHQPDKTNSFVEASKIQGRDIDKEIVIRKLLSKSSGQGEGGVNVVSIVGAGGVGKTAFVQLVFNEDTVTDKFEKKIWVSVSNSFDLIEISKAILEELGEDSSFSNPQPLLKSIKNSISGKKFLLVLDNVHIEDDTRWKSLEVSLQRGAPGSKILVTTRNDKVARIVGSTKHELRPLHDDYCWLILSQIAFQERDKSERAMFENIGREIAKKCRGLPLVAKTIGGLLRFKSSPQEWRNFLVSEMSEKLKEYIFPLLRLSYDELKMEAKRCFSYCAIFPKNSEIKVDELVRIWMAQGLLSSSSRGIAWDMELKGREYFEDLAMRSFFQEFRKEVYGDRIIACKMHDMVHDFAHSLTEDECLIVEKVNGGPKIEFSKDTRHLNIHLQDEDNTSFISLASICKPEELRSLSCKMTIAPNLLAQLRRVRSLIMRSCGLGAIPGEIGNLIHIRYLDVSDNPILELPVTIYELHYLQTLGIVDCEYLRGLPEGIHKLMNLRHLLNGFTSDDFTSDDFKFPQGVEKLTRLQSLGKYDARRGSGNKLGWLKDLNQLGGSLRLYIDSEVAELEAKTADLKAKEWIQDIELDCERAESKVVEALEPQPNLQRLYFRGLHLPKWITTLSHLRSCTLCAFDETKSDVEALLSPLGKLALLEELVLHNWGMRRVVLNNVFRKLKRLEFNHCHMWQEWKEGGNSSILPSLQHLEIRSCPKLKALPHSQISKASSLQILYVQDCEHLRRRYRKDAEDWDKISRISTVVFE